MQEPYHIKICLQEHYWLFKSRKWKIPNFSDKCLICGVADCANIMVIAKEEPDVPNRFRCPGFSGGAIFGYTTTTVRNVS